MLKKQNYRYKKKVRNKFLPFNLIKYLINEDTS